MKKINDADVFKQVSVMITDSNKDELTLIKEKLSLICDFEINNSTLIRGMISYFKDNIDELEKLEDYIKQSRSKVIIDKMFKLIDENASTSEISIKTGINEKTIEKIKSEGNDI